MPLKNRSRVFSMVHELTRPKLQACLFPQIYVDLDDVVASTIEMILGLFEARYRRQIDLTEISSFNLSRSLSLEGDEYINFMREIHSDEALLGIAPIPEAVAALNRLKQEGLVVSMVTGRPAHTREITCRWLEKARIPYGNLMFVRKYSHSGAGTRSVGLRALLRSDFFCAVEDSPKMASFLRRHIKIPVLMLERPWNKEAPGEDRGLVRCQSWRDVEVALRRMLAEGRQWPN